jgi:hypothetical protein
MITLTPALSTTLRRPGAVWKAVVNVSSPWRTSSRRTSRAIVAAAARPSYESARAAPRSWTVCWPRYARHQGGHTHAVELAQAFHAAYLLVVYGAPRSWG